MKNTFCILILWISCSAFGQEKPIDTDSLFNKILSNPKTKFDRKTYSKSIVKEFYELQLNENDWTAFREYYPNNNIKEKGIFLNGDYFGIWKTYDKNGNLILEINYFFSKKIKGSDLGFEKIFDQCKSKADQLIQSHFGAQNNFKLNASRSYWYSDNNSGTWFGKRSEKPKEFLLRYSYNASDTLKFGVIELHFNSDLELIRDKAKGLPNTKPYEFKIDYFKAKEIATSLMYGITNHQNAFKESEYLNLIFDESDDCYKWIISNVPDTKWKAYKDTNSGTITGIGKTLSINCSTGDIDESDFEGTIIVN
ncbi:hypothetical protein [Flexithrix dorotheae]|uniref:hypothetical protein n=1 Tax=Flexithrix dorotheae TaxID=70993 RepID=UPI000378FF72|nr:hypothetical protein [Flexithrix dorotheae]